jgi:hypothetical protein
MIDYKDFKVLVWIFEAQKHWSDSLGWEIEEYLHNQILATTKVVL